MLSLLTDEGAVKGRSFLYPQELSDSALSVHSSPGDKNTILSSKDSQIWGGGEAQGSQTPDPEAQAELGQIWAEHSCVSYQPALGVGNA